jgi:hypothetical protein
MEQEDQKIRRACVREGRPQAMVRGQKPFPFFPSDLLIFLFPLFEHSEFAKEGE